MGKVEKEVLKKVLKEVDEWLEGFEEQKLRPEVEEIIIWQLEETVEFLATKDFSNPLTRVELLAIKRLINKAKMFMLCNNLELFKVLNIGYWLGDYVITWKRNLEKAEDIP